MNLTTTPYRSEKFAHYLSLLQKYTKEQFTWNLLLLREEEEES